MLALAGFMAVPGLAAAQDAGAPPPSGAPEAQGPAASPPSGAPEAQEEDLAPQQPPPPLFEPPPPRRYGDQGMSEISVGLGYSSLYGFLGAGGFRYFVIDALAPGVEGTYVAGGTNVASYGLALGSLRFVPVRTSSMALVLTGRAGRMFLADHADGWGAGAGAGVLISLGGGAGLELGYQFLRLLPASFCADLSTCVLHGPVLGLRFSF